MSTGDRSLADYGCGLTPNSWTRIPGEADIETAGRMNGGKDGEDRSGRVGGQCERPDASPAFRSVQMDVKPAAAGGHSLAAAAFTGFAASSEEPSVR
jgi:hypothetical protein